MATCKYCNQSNLEWVENPPKTWRLYSGDEQHKCKPSEPKPVGPTGATILMSGLEFLIVNQQNHELHKHLCFCNNGKLESIRKIKSSECGIFASITEFIEKREGI